MRSPIGVQFSTLILLLISVVPAISAVSERIKQQSIAAATKGRKYRIPLEQCKERFHSIDSNDDGIVTKKEYFRFIQELTSYEQSTACPVDDSDASTTAGSSSNSATIRDKVSNVNVETMVVETFNTVACFCNEIPLPSTNISKTNGQLLRHSTTNINKTLSRDDLRRRKNNGENNLKCCSTPLVIPFSEYPEEYVHRVCNYVIEKLADHCRKSVSPKNNSPTRTTIKKILVNLMNSKTSESTSESADDIFASRNAQENDSYSNLNYPGSISSNTRIDLDGTNNHLSIVNDTITDDEVTADESSDYEQKNMKLILVLILLCCCLFVVVLFYVWIQRQRKQALIQQTNDGLMLSSDHIKFESYNNSFTERSGDTTDISFSEDNVRIQEIEIQPETLNLKGVSSSSHHSKSSKGSPLATKYYYSPRNRNNNYNIVYYSDGNFLYPNQTRNSSKSSQSLTKISSSIYNTLASSSGHTKATTNAQEITINPSIQYEPKILEDQVEFTERNTIIRGKPSFSSMIADIQTLDCRQDSFYDRYRQKKQTHNHPQQQYVSNPQEDDGSSTISPFVVFTDGDVTSSHGSIESSIYSPIHRMNSSHTAVQSHRLHPNRHVKQLSAPRDALDYDIHLRKLKDLETPSSSLHGTKVYRREHGSTKNSLNSSSSHTNSSSTPDSDEEMAWNEFERQCSNSAEDELSVGLSLADFDHMLIAKSNHTAISEKRKQKLLSQSYKIELQSNKARAGKSRRSLSKSLSASKLVAISPSSSDRKHRDLSKSPKSKATNHRTRTHSESPIKKRHSQKKGKHRRSHSSDTSKSRSHNETYDWNAVIDSTASDENWESVHLSQC